MSGVNNVVLNRFEEMKRRVRAGKQIGRCHSEERGDEGLSLWRQGENRPDMIGKTIPHYHIEEQLGAAG